MIGTERQDLRHTRAMALFAAIWHIVAPRLNPEEDPRHLRRELMELFTTEGVEVLTDYTRSEIGLPPRDGKGWTIDELLALERLRLDLMTRPLPQFDPGMGMTRVHVRSSDEGP